MYIVYPKILRETNLFKILIKFVQDFFVYCVVANVFIYLPKYSIFILKACIYKLYCKTFLLRLNFVAFEIHPIQVANATDIGRKSNTFFLFQWL